jgi:hypothetical protein
LEGIADRPPALVSRTREERLCYDWAECGRAVRGLARAGSLQTIPTAAGSAAALRLPRRPRARSSPGSRAAGSVRRYPAPGCASGPAGTAAGGPSRLLLLPNQEVRATGSERPRRSLLAPRRDARRGDRGGCGGRRTGTLGGAAGGLRVGAWAPRLCGTREGRRGCTFRLPPAQGSPSQGEPEDPSSPVTRGLQAFQRTVQRWLWWRGLEASGWDWQADGRSDPGGAQWVHAAGVGRAEVLGTRGPWHQGRVRPWGSGEEE